MKFEDYLFIIFKSYFPFYFYPNNPILQKKFVINYTNVYFGKKFILNEVMLLRYFYIRSDKFLYTINLLL